MKTLLLARVHLGVVAVLSVLTLSACLLVAGLPRAMQGSFDDALRRTLRSALAQQVDLTVRFESHGAEEDLRERGQFDSRDKEFRGLVPAALKPLVSPPGTGTGHMSAETFDTPVNGAGGSTYLNLGWLSDADRRVSWVAGRAPGTTGSTRWNGASIPLYEVGIVDEARSVVGLQLGQTKIIGETHPAAVKIVGVFQAKDPADPYWTHHSEILHATTVVPPGKVESEKYTTALIPDSALAVLSGADRNLTYSWVLPIAPATGGSFDVPELGAAVASMAKTVTLHAADNGAGSAFSRSQYRLDTGLPKLLSDFLTALATAQTVMFLVLGGLLVVALGVIVLGVQLLVDRMDGALALVRARGGSLRQVAGGGARLVALAVGPAALAGYALSYLVPGPMLPVVHAGPLLVLVTAVGFAAARLAVTHRTPLHERRDDVAGARPSARRITLEVLVIGLALAGAYLLRTRGLTTRVAEEGQDPFLLFVPVALTLAAALVTMRCYPYPLRLLARLAARRRPAVPFLGLTTAARARSASVLPVLILLPALAVSVFAAVVSSGISSTQRLASWQSVGAPIKLTSRLDLPADAVERVRRVPGVELLVPAQTGRVQLGYLGENAEILAVDLAGWQRLLDGAPISVPAAPDTSSGVPALVSPELRGRRVLDVGWQQRTKVVERGVVPALPGFFTRGKFLIVPFGVNQRPMVNTLLIKGDADPAALVKAAGTGTVTTQAGALAAITGDPLTGTVRDVLLITTVALAAYALVAVVVMLVIGAADRARALTFLRTLGLSDRQAQGLTILEILPLVLVTALVGLALGLGLPAALGPGVDLSSYAGDLAVGDYDLDLITPTALAAGLAAVALLGAYAHTAISRRRNLGAVLRVGDLS
ncbi:FtsX-like permease family protein [Nonomuraea sp. NPDC000554]|uniref:FtsX-like permease family protein n=1 Tax=Nonomuraea sp. NPDC000554 TaxID=3154259 RepID=UPI00332C8F43